MVKSLILISSVSLVSLAAPACADEGDSSQIVVTAGRAEQPLSHVGQSVTVIDADTIRTRQLDTVADLLRQVPGINIARNGSTGGFASVFIRGASSEHTVALIDGVKMNDPSSPGAGFDFGRLLTGNIDRIEVVRGSQSVLWGSQAIGGVVNMITRHPGQELAVDGRAEYGYRDTGEIVGNVAGKFGPVAASVGAGYFRTDGISSFSEARGGREKDGYHQFGANAKFNIALNDAISVDLRGWYADGKNDMDGGFPFGDTAAYARTKEYIGYSALNVALLDGRFRSRFAYVRTQIDRDNFNPAASPMHQIDSRGQNERFEYQGMVDVTEGVSATFGGETEKSSFRSTSDFGFGASTDKGAARLTSFYGQLSITPLKGLTTNVGLRHDRHTDFGNHVSFSANGVYSPNEGNTTVRASYGEGFKAPTLYQLFSVYGNRALRPETAKSWDVSVAQRALDGAVEASATWFHRKTTNLVDFNYCNAVGDPSPLCVSDGFGGVLFGFYDNVAAARAHGLELELMLHPVAALDVSAHYSFTKSTDATTGLDQARRPRHNLGGSIDYRWPFGLKTGASLTHFSASFNDAFNTQRLPDYVLVDIRASYPLVKGVELYGRIENLFDAQYETALGYGSPGRAVYAGVRFGF